MLQSSLCNEIIKVVIALSCIIRIHETILSIIFALLLVDNGKFSLHVHAWFDMSRVVFGQFILLVLLTLLLSDRTRINFFVFINVLHCTIFSMPRIPNNLRERAICMLDAGISTEHVARHVECSSRVIRNRLRENGLHARRPYVGCVLMQCHREFNSVLYFTQTIIYMVPEVIKQYNNYSSMKANKKFMKLMGEQS